MRKAEASKVTILSPRATAGERLTKLPEGIGPLWRLCKVCHGSGEKDGLRKSCSNCNGIGEVLS
jgi:hypothetical protein